MPARPASRPRSPGRRRPGSVLVIVLTTLMFAAVALVAFMDRAAVDLLVDHREAVKRRLRVEAFSALELTLGVLAEFREAGQGLKSPSEGWNDPLGFAGYEPGEGRQVEVTFEDESGKLSLPRVSAETLQRLFAVWEVPPPKAEEITDALLGWMKPGHVSRTPWPPNYESALVPYAPPGRPLRSYGELAAIERAREFFHDEAGRPNAFWRRFVENVSLFDFPQPNLNGARPDVLAALGQYGPEQAREVGEFLRGEGRFGRSGPGFFRDPREVGRIAGPAGSPAGFGMAIAALRVTLTVREGRNEYRLSAVIAPPGGATPVAAVERRPATPPGTAPAPVPPAPRPGASPPAAGAARPDPLQYPFTILELRENEEISRGGPP